KLYEVLEEWKVLLTKADEEKLNSSPFKDRDDIWYLILSNINIHNSYHIGQIVTIRKQQGNWVNENDV
nr:DinB family protein [Ignavibacteria bacterium]